MHLDSRARVSLAEQVRALSTGVPEEVTDLFLRQHPDWIARYGDRARVLGIEDARYHLTFLAAAVESGATSAFTEYAQWTARVLQARGIAPVFLSENLAQIRRALSPRLAEHARPVIDEYVTAALTALGALEQSGGGEPPPRTPPAHLALTRAMYLQAVLAGERKAALTVAREALRDNPSAEDLYVDVLQAALHEVGRLWETNRITVAHEHAATAITQSVMAHLYEQLDRSADARGTLLITGLEGEMHSVGAHMVADVLETHGWTVHFLGTNLPHKAIVDAVRERQPECVGISATMLFSIPAARRLIDALRDEWGLSKRIVLGGSAFRHGPDLWQELGADAHARDLREAVGVMCQ